jgi:hypothetical protein
MPGSRVNIGNAGSAKKKSKNSSVMKKSKGGAMMRMSKKKDLDI